MRHRKNRYPGVMYAYSVQAIRDAEAPLIGPDDALMKQAAGHVAQAAATLLAETLPNAAYPGNVLVVAGSGGNGGDGLYAGAELARAGHHVEAIRVGTRIHERAAAAFEHAGGQFVTKLGDYDLVIDSIIGLGGSKGLSDDLAALLARCAGTPILAIDVPSGINPDTGVPMGAHITATATVTFGALRYAHAVSPACGEVVVGDIGIAPQGSHVQVYRSVGTGRVWPEGLHPIPRIPAIESLEPGPDDHKYSRGVVGLLAGSERYPGAGVLCVQGAVRATPSMVRYVGAARDFVLDATPEVIASSLATAGKVQAWVAGPGGATTAELRDLLSRNIPLLIDADGIKLLAKNADLMELLANRTAATVVTPHDAEFATLAEVAGISRTDRLTDTQALAKQLGIIVVRKGRFTLVATPGSEPITSINSGHSWSATPGSGDVLAGVMGAWLARYAALGRPLHEAAIIAVHLCADAAWLAAQTPYGPAPTSASPIAAHVQDATARLTATTRR